MASPYVCRRLSTRVAHWIILVCQISAMMSPLSLGGVIVRTLAYVVDAIGVLWTFPSLIWAAFTLIGVEHMLGRLGLSQVLGSSGLEIIIWLAVAYLAVRMFTRDASPGG